MSNHDVVIGNGPTPDKGTTEGYEAPKVKLSPETQAHEAYLLVNRLQATVKSLEARIAALEAAKQ
jgi:hypothetical protein